MKKTLTINISGLVFHIDEDAFEKLQGYLKSLNNKFGATEEGREIITDIESRIAEIFAEKTNVKQGVITIKDVEKIIEIMGKPEEIDASEDDTTEQETKQDYRRHRRLYRDPENTVISGVSGGLAAYFSVDPVLVRVIFIILIFVLGPVDFLIYIILWAAVPVARTTAQKLEMRGEKVTVSNIEKSIKDEFKNVKENYREYKTSKEYQNTKDGLTRILEVFGIIIKAMFKIILIIIGIAFVFSGAIILIMLISALFAGGVAGIHLFGFNNLAITPFLNAFSDPGIVWLFTTALFFVAFIPILAIVYGGVKLIFKFKSNDKVIGLTSLGLWLISLGVIIVIGISEASNFRSNAKNSETFIINYPQGDTLYLKSAINQFKDLDSYDDYYDLNNLILIEDEDEYKIFGKPELDIVQSNNPDIELIIKKRSRGKSKYNARQNANLIKYHWSQKDSLILFDPYFTIPENKKWRQQQYNIILKLPVGKTVYLDHSLIDIIYDIDNVTNTYDSKMVDKFWTMQPDGLTKSQ
ncbi:MAG: PspC domain-containing protein [Chlorobi bacterium]|nr:PspC domain-containing protein [Chlorobiota bacterium]